MPAHQLENQLEEVLQFGRCGMTSHCSDDASTKGSGINRLSNGGGYFRKATLEEVRRDAAKQAKHLVEVFTAS